MIEETETAEMMGALESTMPEVVVAIDVPVVDAVVEVVPLDVVPDVVATAVAVVEVVPLDVFDPALVCVVPVDELDVEPVAEALVVVDVAAGVESVVVDVGCCASVVGGGFGVVAGEVDVDTPGFPAASAINALIFDSVFGPTAPIDSMPFCS